MTIDHERPAPDDHDDDTPAEGETLDVEDVDTDETPEDVEDTDTSDDVLDVDDLDTDEDVEDTDDDVDTSYADADEDLAEPADLDDLDTTTDAETDDDTIDETEIEAEPDPVAEAAQGYFDRADATDTPDVPDEVEALEDTPFAAEPAPAATFDTDGPFLPDSAILQQRWDGIQIGFVDEPLDAVGNAGDLVAEVLDELTNSLAARREELESQWRNAADISTEDLRVVFQAYRALFKRIVL